MSKERINEEYEKKITEFRNFVTGYARSDYEDRKEVYPLIIALIPGDKGYGIAVIDGIAQFFLNDATKDILPKVMDKMNTELKPLALAMISEAYVVKKSGDFLEKDGSYKKGYRISEDPERQSAIMIMFETFTKTTTTSMILNEEDQVITEVEEHAWEAKVEDGKYRGRFYNLLKDHSGLFADMIEKQIFGDGEKDTDS